MLFVSFVIALCFVSSSAIEKTFITVTKFSELFGKIADGFEKHGASKESVKEFRAGHEKSFHQKIRDAGSVVKEEGPSKNLRAASYTSQFGWKKVYDTTGSGCASEFVKL